ncbi:MAG: GNAT family N-acetyltransferase, partial [Lachnospiraceae bacterium]|nr:GNAT family N-acetyltransferase [Lachnospiraceae bacterium]
VGQIRLTVEEGEALIDYSVAPAYRGKGYGAELLRLLCQQLDIDKITSVTKLIGQVKYQNQASAKVFEKSGFRKTMLPAYIQYEKEMSR